MKMVGRERERDYQTGGSDAKEGTHVEHWGVRREGEVGGRGGVYIRKRDPAARRWIARRTLLG